MIDGQYSRLTFGPIAVLCAVLLATPAALAQAIDRTTCGVVPGENLVVFVGRKLDVQPFTPKLSPGEVLMDLAFRARYQVVQLLCGDLKTPEVEFEVYDHYGTPRFAEFETVLLFLSREDGQLYHQKYQYSDVYETAEGSWAGCGDPYKLEPEVHRASIRAKPMTYKHPVTFSVQGLSEDEIRKYYPLDFFERQEGVVVCRAGAPLADLFEVKRAGVLKARGLFR